MIQKITINGYKTLYDCTVELGNLNVFIGENASGKTNFLNAIGFLHKVTGQNFDFLRGDVLQEFQRSRLNGRSIYIQIKGEDEENKYTAEMQITEFYDAQNLLTANVELSGNLRYKSSPASQPSLSLQNLNQLLEVTRIYKDLHTDTKAEIRKPQAVAPFNYLSEDGGNLVNVLFKYLNDREFRDAIEKVLRFAIPDFEELYVDSPAGNFVNLTWKEKYLGRELYASDLSDGTLRLLSLCAILLPNKKVTPPKLICIDEPELGLHPRLLKLLAELIQSKSEESQIIITTHSPEFLSFFKLEEIVAVRREAGKTYFERPASKERLKTMLENYETSIGELWLQGELGDTSLKLPQ